MRKSRGNGIDADITACPVLILNPVCVAEDEDPEKEHLPYTERADIYTPQAKAIRKTIRDIMAAYNYDRSDTMTDDFDVNFYAGGGFNWRLEKTQREAIKEALGAGLTIRPKWWKGAPGR